VDLHRLYPTGYSKARGLPGGERGAAAPAAAV
jgi:hypothetical protein